MAERYAAIDFGTNTARLLIGEVDGSGAHSTLLVDREIVRMGGGFSGTTGLSPEARQRALACLDRFAGQMRRHGVAAVRAVATSAVRDAANRDDFLAQVRRETGILLQVIDGDLEGELTLRGVIHGLDRKVPRVMVLDVGGGSTEVTLAEECRPTFVESMPIGVVRVTEGFGSVPRMQARIVEIIGGLVQRMARDGVAVPPDTTLVATAGTATTLAAISLRMEEYDYRRVNNYLLERVEIEAILERLLPLEPHERLNVPGLEKGREDLIIAGILIVLHVMEQFGFRQLKVSDYGLLEGVALSPDLLTTVPFS